MDNSFIDDWSDAVSGISQDRMSDDTDFLVGQNISFSNLNDSYIDARTSTTTDLIYQNELNENDGDIVVPTSQERFKAGNDQVLIKEDVKEQTSSIEYLRQEKMNKQRNEHHLNFERIISKQQNELGFATEHNSKEKRDDQLKDEENCSNYRNTSKELSHDSNDKSQLGNQSKNQNLSNEMSKSREEIRSGKDSANSSGSKWKYRSMHDSSDEDFSFGKDLNHQGSAVFSESFADHDPKVKEGEELLAKLLGRVTLAESLRSNAITSKEVNLSNKANWKDQSQTSRYGALRSQFPGSTSTVSSSKDGRFASDWRNEKSADPRSQNDVRIDITSPYSDRSAHSKASTASVNRRSSHEILESHSIVDRMSNHSGDVEGLMKRTGAVDEQLRRHPDSPGRSLSSIKDERYSSSMSATEMKRESSGSIRVEYTKEYVKGTHQFQNIDGESRDRSRSSSLEKQQQQQKQEILMNLADNEMATSTPQKITWPLSPIRRAVDLKLEESEALVAKNERKLKEMQLLIEQESIRKEAIIEEKTSAEESLAQIKKNISSLEQLAEEHKKQTVNTRTELMELEQKRDETQRKLNQVAEDLRRQKKDLESLPEELKGSNISTKIAMLQDERDELKRECKILKEKCKENDHISSANMDLMKKMRAMQEQLYNEQDISRDKLRKLREELENEKRKAVEANIEQMTTLRKTRDEMMDAKKAELDTAMERLENEKRNEIESIKERYGREVKALHQRIEELEDENQRIIKSNNDRVSKLQEQSEVNNKREIDNLIKRFKSDKQNEMAILNQRHQREIEEMKLDIKSKHSEIENLQALLKQQAESTRLLGEKLRSESKEQICLAVEKERDTRLEELRTTELELEKVKEERDALSSESNTELINKESENERLRNIINKLKKELEDARQENYEAREEKFQAISKTRSAMKEEVDKLKAKLREMEKVEQMTVLELNEEFLKTSAVTGVSYPAIKKNYSFDKEDANSVSEALNTLRLSNNDLRKLTMTYKRKFEESRHSDESFNMTNRSDVELSKTPDRAVRTDRSRTPDRARTPDRVRTPDRARTPDGVRTPDTNGSSEESRSARILKHLQSRVRQLREGNESMKKSFGSDDGDNDLDTTARSQTPEQAGDSSFSNSSADTLRLEAALRNAEEQAQKYAGMLSQKMAENTKLQKMLTHASKENIKLERLHSILQHKVATSGISI